MQPPFSFGGNGEHEQAADRNPRGERLYGRGAGASAGASSAGRDSAADRRPPGGEAAGRGVSAVRASEAADAGEDRGGRLVRDRSRLLLPAARDDAGSDREAAAAAEGRGPVGGLPAGGSADLCAVVRP